MEGNSARPLFTPSSPSEDSRQRPQQQHQQPYEFRTAGSKGRNYNLSSASPPPPLPYQRSTLTTKNQHMRTHLRSFSGTLSPCHVPYHVTVSGAGCVKEIWMGKMKIERMKRRRRKSRWRWVGRYLSTSMLCRGGHPLRGRQSPRSPPPLLSTTFGPCASPKSPSHLSSSPLTYDNAQPLIVW